MYRVVRVPVVYWSGRALLENVCVCLSRPSVQMCSGACTVGGRVRIQPRSGMCTYLIRWRALLFRVRLLYGRVSLVCTCTVVYVNGRVRARVPWWSSACTVVLGKRVLCDRA